MFLVLHYAAPVLSAPQYVEHLQSWLRRYTEAESPAPASAGGSSGATASNQQPAVFPTRLGQPFAPEFESVARCTARHLLRVLLHLYASHFAQLASLGMAPHLNSTTRHLLLLARLFRPASARPSAAAGSPLEDARVLYGADLRDEVAADLAAALLKP